jgi:hypothetical protein
MTMVNINCHEKSYARFPGSPGVLLRTYQEHPGPDFKDARLELVSPFDYT